MPSYTNNVPQANQQISTTQTPIQNNFDYIQKAVGQEHNFVANDTDPTHTYHLLASMPNRALSPALPAGTNGVYFVSGGIAYFYDGTLNYPLSPFCVRAAVNFDGVPGSPTIRSSFNVTSVTKNGTGDYTINFTTALPSNNYLVQCTGMRNSNDDISNGQVRGTATYGNSVSTTSLRVQFNGGSSSLADVLMGNVIVFGG